MKPILHWNTFFASQGIVYRMIHNAVYSTLCACPPTARSSCCNETKDRHGFLPLSPSSDCVFLWTSGIAKFPIHHNTHLTAGTAHALSLYLLGIFRRKKGLKLSVKSVFNSILLVHWAVVTCITKPWRTLLLQQKSQQKLRASDFWPPEEVSEHKLKNSFTFLFIY